MEVTAICSGKVYHDSNGIEYYHFIAETPNTPPRERLITLPVVLFGEDFKTSDICSIELKRVG